MSVYELYARNFISWKIDAVGAGLGGAITCANMRLPALSIHKDVLRNVVSARFLNENIENVTNVEK